MNRYLTLLMVIFLIATAYIIIHIASCQIPKNLKPIQRYMVDDKGEVVETIQYQKEENR